MIYKGIKLIKLENSNYLYAGEDGYIYTIYKSEIPYKKKINYKDKYPTIKINNNTTLVKNIIAKYFILNPHNYKNVLYKTENYIDNTPSNIMWSNNNGAKRTGLRYKKKVGSVYEDFKIISILPQDKLTVECTKCSREEILSRNNLYRNKKCDCDKNLKLDLKKENIKDFKTWKIISEDKTTENKPKSYKIITVKCNCGKEKKINYKNFTKKLVPCKCQNVIISEKEDEVLRNRLGNIKNRCYNPNNKSYKRYGGRGIKVCDEWVNNTNSFIRWAKENGYKPGLEIDRENNNGNYEPNNCRWTTKAENNRNQSTTKLNWELVEEIRNKDFKRLNYKEIGEIYGVSRNIISNCLNYKTWNKKL